MSLLRIAIALIMAAILAVALVPMGVLLDLAAGGDGWGICRGGLGSCRAAYFEGPELLAGLVVVLFLLLMLLRLVVVLRRRVQTRRESMSRGERFSSR